MHHRWAGWVALLASGALYVFALANDTSCTSSHEWRIVIGTLGGWTACAAALRLGAGPRQATRWMATMSLPPLAMMAACVAVAFIPTLVVGGTASSLQMDYCAGP
jgi:hypothetical protein